MAHYNELIQATESILRAKGTCLKNYMPKSQEEILNAVDKVIKDSQKDLLAALKNIVASAMYCNSDEICIDVHKDKIEQARIAIAKAEGK